MMELMYVLVLVACQADAPTDCADLVMPGVGPQQACWLAAPPAMAEYEVTHPWLQVRSFRCERADEKGA